MAFGQLTYRESLRDIEACLRSAQRKLYHMGFEATSPATVKISFESHWIMFPSIHVGEHPHKMFPEVFTP